MVGRNKGSVLLYIIVGLAVIGLVASLIKKPGSFLMSIFVMIGIAFVIFMIMRAVLNRKGAGSTDEMKKYKKAVKQSKMKYKKEQTINKKQTTSAPTHSKAKRKRRHGPHLTVIEGKKDANKDDRASHK